MVSVVWVVVSVVLGDCWVPLVYYPYSAVISESCLSVFFFFFQAEDGIRDLTVTGVQTCALPISHVCQDQHAERQRRIAAGVHLQRYRGAHPEIQRLPRRDGRARPGDGRRREIGRASCRERV